MPSSKEIQDIIKEPGLTLSVKQVSKIIGCTEKTLRYQLIENPNFFGFRVMIITCKGGYKKIRIPKMPFIKYITEITS